MVSTSNGQIIPISKISSVSHLLLIELCIKNLPALRFSFLKQEISFMKLHKIKSFRHCNNFQQASNDKTCHKNAVPQKIVLLENNSSFFLQELHNCKKLKQYQTESKTWCSIKKNNKEITKRRTGNHQRNRSTTNR